MGLRATQHKGLTRRAPALQSGGRGALLRDSGHDPYTAGRRDTVSDGSASSGALKKTLRFLFSPRRIWLGTLLVLLLILGMILLLGESSALAPFIYGAF